MPRNDGNKPRKEEILALARTERNLRRARLYLDEHAGELTPEAINNLKDKISCKIRTLEQSQGTFQGL